MVGIQRLGRHRRAGQEQPGKISGRRRTRLVTAIVATGLAVILIGALVVHGIWRPATAGHPAPQHSAAPRHSGLPAVPGSYLGLYSHGAPASFAPVRAFATATGVKPNVVVYYSGWLEPFKTAFAETAASEGAIPLVQINPTRTSVAAIATGYYDGYLTTYAKAIRSYHRPVILSFGHEMNGYWYSWGHKHTSPATFVAGWRHIVKLFRALGTKNVTWLWTVNIIHRQTGVPSPGPWWPGSSYVNWVGVDGYFIKSSAVFASVFGPTIVYLRSLTHDPIIITETSATPHRIQASKITDIFAGVHLYGLLGFVWFNSVDKVDWRITSPAAIAAFRQGAAAYRRATS